MASVNALLYVVFFVSLYFEVFLLLTFIENRKKMAPAAADGFNGSLPAVTIIVPAYNEEKTIGRTIESLLSLEYPKEKLEIIVVDDGSTDRTWEAAKNWEQYRQVRMFKKENGGKYTALNLGLEKTTTELVGCLDADSFVHPLALQKIVPNFLDSKVMAVTPAIKIHQPDNIVRHIQSNEYNLGIFIKKIFDFLGAINVTPGPFSIYRKKVFDTLGPFKHAYNTEDMEIALRMQKNFYKITNAHEAMVYTVGPKSVRKLYRQRVRWIHGFLQNTIDYRGIILNPRYGNLGFFTLPTAVFGFVGAIFVFGVGLWRVGGYIVEKSVELATVGLAVASKSFRLDWFSVNIDSKLFLGVVLVAMTFLLITFGQRISEKKSSFSPHIMYFPFLYPLLSIFWLVKALHNTLFSRATTWR